MSTSQRDIWRNELLGRSKTVVAGAVAAVFFLSFASGRAMDRADSLIGRWYTRNNEAIFEFYRTGDSYCGRLFPLKIPDLVDSLNPVDSLRSRRVAGATLIRGLIYKPEKRRWENGRVYNPSDGKTYNCHCRLIEGGRRLEFRGYLGVCAIGQTQIWTRVEKQ